ncbi:toxin-antitoxin system YwqK family antitoxin [Enterobacter hormaechei]
MYNPKLSVFKTRCVHISSFSYLVMCALIVPIIVSANTGTYFCDSSTNSELRYNNTIILKKYENGNLASIQEVNNEKFNGLYESWWRNGNRRAQGRFKNGREDGAFFAWYKNGRKYFSGSMRDGKSDGAFNTWFADGKIRNQGIFLSGKRIGQWRSWYDSGQQSSIVNFEEDKILECSFWNDAGETIYQGKDTKRCNDIYVSYYNTYSLESDEPG